jgi:hypothetical protein
MWLENIDSRYFGWKIFGMNILRLSRIWWSKRSSRLKQKAARAQLVGGQTFYFYFSELRLINMS